MRLFVTGIGGFIGGRLARLALGRGDAVAGAYYGEAPDLPGVEMVDADLLGVDRALEDAVAAFAPDVVIHLAGLSHIGASWRDPAAYYRVNVLGTDRVLAAAGGRRVVLASSAEVYGAVPENEQPIAEERTLAPPSPYALTKATAERAVRRGQGVVVRSFNLIGSGQARTFALPAFAEQLAAIEAGEQEAVLRVGNLEARRDFVHVEDGARAFLAVAERGEAGEAYNIATGRSRSLRAVVDRLIEVSGVGARIEIDPERLRPVDVPLLQGDSRRLRNLGWRPERDLDDALRDLWSEARARRTS